MVSVEPGPVGWKIVDFIFVVFIEIVFVVQFVVILVVVIVVVDVAVVVVIVVLVVKHWIHILRTIFCNKKRLNHNQDEAIAKISG